MTLRTDGFVSVHAPYAGGELITKLLKFAGDQLTINYSTSAAGSMRIELQTPDGQAIEGFALADCPAIIGDEIDHVVQWNSGRNLRSLAGKPVRLRFVLQNADLYSLRFIESSPQQ